MAKFVKGLPHAGKKKKVMARDQFKEAVRGIMDTVADMSQEQQAGVAGSILEWAGVSRETFAAFWEELEDTSKEELGGWLMLMLDGDEEEAEEVNPD